MKKMKNIFNKIVGVIANIALLIGTLAPLATPAPAYATTAWNVGDVFVGVSSGSYQVYDNAGLFKETISDGLGGGVTDFTTGCAFNNTLDKLYTTYFGQTKVKVYNDAIAHTLSQTIDTGVVNAGGHSESVVFAGNGDFYVGHPDGNDDIQRYDAAGVYQQSYDVPIESRGSDWLDLAADQQTMFYTSEGGLVKRYDVSGAGAPIADFAAIGGVSYALRLLPPGDGSGGLLVANSTDIKRLDGTGAVVQTYDAAGENQWFALNLDPNGTSFWSGDLTTANFYRFNIASGAIEVGPINTGTGFNTLAGICLKGELTAGQPEDEHRMTGGGTVVGTVAAGTPSTIRHGFELHCDITRDPNRLEVNWGKGNKFHLESLASAACSDDPGFSEGQPVAGFDTYKGSGTGRYNGVSGATAEWVFTDRGEPGKSDTVKLKIVDVGGATVVDIVGLLQVGNQQAHAQ